MSIPFLANNCDCFFEETLGKYHKRFQDKGSITVDAKMVKVDFPYINIFFEFLFDATSSINQMPRIKFGLLSFSAR